MGENKRRLSTSDDGTAGTRTMPNACDPESINNASMAPSGSVSTLMRYGLRTLAETLVLTISMHSARKTTTSQIRVRFTSGFP